MASLHLRHHMGRPRLVTTRYLPKQRDYLPSRQNVQQSEARGWSVSETRTSSRILRIYEGWSPVMPTPTNQLDSMVAAAKRQLDDARRDGNPTLIRQSLAVLNGRLDRKLKEREQVKA